jgi:hypothetical protein
MAILLLIFAAAGLLFFRRWMLDALIDFLNNFRGGGPPTPMHPSPANDTALLRRRPGRKAEH